VLQPAPALEQPRNAPELIEERERLRAWCFYDPLCTDRDASARMLHVGTRTPVLQMACRRSAKSVMAVRSRPIPRRHAACLGIAGLLIGRSCALVFWHIMLCGGRHTR
jgi:hypothetical protein